MKNRSCPIKLELVFIELVNARSRRLRQEDPILGAFNQQGESRKEERENFEGRKQGRKPRRDDVSASKYDEKSLPEKKSFKREKRERETEEEEVSVNWKIP